MNLKHSLTKTAGKRLVAISFAALCLLGMNTTPAPANAETPASSADTCPQVDPSHKYYFWVQTREHTKKKLPLKDYVGYNEIAKVEINADFNGGVVSDRDRFKTFSDPEKIIPFGDIAAFGDSLIYGIEQVTFYDKSVSHSPRLLKYQKTGEEWSSQEMILHGSDFGAADEKRVRPYSINSLILTPDKKLIFGTGLSDSNVLVDADQTPDGYTDFAGKIYLIDPNNPTTTSIGPGVEVSELKIKFPKIKIKDETENYMERQVASAGDFLFLPDGSLIGFGTTGFEESDHGIIVKWKINNKLETVGTNPETPAPEGVVIGKTEKHVIPYGAGRVGSHILFVADQTPKTDKNQMTVQDLDLSNAKEMGALPKIDEIPYLKSKVFKVPKFRAPVYGASSAADAGQQDNELKLIVKTVFSNAEKKADGTSKYPSGRLRDEDQASAYSTDGCGHKLTPAPTTTGTKPGIQDVEHQEFVVAGTKHKLIESLSTVSTRGFYDVSLSCVDGANKNIPVDQFGLTSKKASSVITIPQKGDITGPITCTFTNTPVGRPRPTLPLTGAETTPWQILGGTVLLGVLAAYPLARRMKTEGKAK